jgi:hypothetical protein
MSTTLCTSQIQTTTSNVTVQYSDNDVYLQMFWFNIVIMMYIYNGIYSLRSADCMTLEKSVNVIVA